MLRVAGKTNVPVRTMAMNESATSRESMEWEMRPGGMLVQKRVDGSNHAAVAPTIRVRVKYGSAHHEVHISSQATFGELKKLLSSQTGLHPQDQKLFFKDKERDSNAFLDITGVKDKSKLFLVEDPQSQERRYLEMRKNAKMEKAAKAINDVSLEVDKLAGQVSSLESVISGGEKVAEKDVLGLTELLMTQLIKLDGIMAEGDVKTQRRVQVRRVQKYVETLDSIKLRNSMIPNKQQPPTNPPVPSSVRSRVPPASQPVVVTKWETFEPAPLPSSSSSKVGWDLFD